jgi:hypothetical protein
VAGYRKSFLKSLGLQAASHKWRIPAPLRLPGPLGARKRDDIRQHTIRVRIRQSVCGILIHRQPATGDELVRGATGQFQFGRFVDAPCRISVGVWTCRKRGRITATSGPSCRNPSFVGCARFYDVLDSSNAECYIGICLRVCRLSCERDF